MGGTDDLISFDVIESQKENIQSLPGGRSAKQLAALYSSGSVGSAGSSLAPQLTPTPLPGETKTLHDRIRADFEAEVAGLSESDDPLDVYDRYVRWTLEAYPSAQATAQSQLHVLLERATRAFVGAAQYRNDPRYLRLWLHYIRLFSDAPREAYVYLARHGIGEGLALFYEEYAAWLEGAGRWVQADEVLRLGIDRAARPEARLLRKYAEFEHRRAATAPDSLDVDPNRPSSPALPIVRPALAAKVDPFAAASAATAAARDPQQAQRLQQSQQQQQPSHQAARTAKPKMAIFSDAAAVEPASGSALPAAGASSKGWQSIGSLAERKKENTVAAKPWTGEKLSAGGKKTAAKMAVFRDASLAKSHITIHPAQYQVTVNPQSRKKERVFVDLRAVYPTPEEPGTELSFEEIWAANRGLLHRSWAAVERRRPALDVLSDVDLLADTVSTKLVVHRDTVLLDENGAPVKGQDRESRPRKKKATEINETQIIKTKLDSPSGRKMKKRSSTTSEPTMTMHTRAATDDIYEIFNQPMQPASLDDDDAHEASDDDYETDGDYTSGAESTATTREVGVEEADEGDEDEADDVDDVDDVDDGDDADDGDRAQEVNDLVDLNEVEETSDAKNVSEWSGFVIRRDTPEPANADADEALSPLPVRVLAQHASSGAASSTPSSPLMAPVEDEDEADAPRTRTAFIPIPPEDYVAPTRPYRDPVEAANNRLPFMTPITERTESSVAFDAEDSRRAMMAKTPSKAGMAAMLPSPDEDDEDELEEEEEEPGGSSALASEPMSSPLMDLSDENDLPQPSPVKLPQPLFQRPAPAASPAPAARAGPIIHDLQCNPIDESVRAAILAQMEPPLSSYEGFYDHHGERYDKGSEIRKYAKAVARSKAGGSDRTSDAGLPVVISFPDGPSQYTVRRELGAGAFAPVYLVESVPADSDGAKAEARRPALEALKMETPPTVWEFHMMRLAHARLGPAHRATASLAPGLACHLYRDETFLFLPFYAHGTLLDVVNLFRGEASGVMDETLAMFFAVELFRTVEALHAHGLLHGDIKADNCLLRLDELEPSTGGGGGGGGGGSALTSPSPWRADGGDGWAARGVTLIDFGRAIDMRAFAGDVRFVADWRTTAQDCPEMREGRPWTWQIDCHGLAGTLHTLLFGKYMETVRCDAGGLGGLGGSTRRYRIRETLKRYWQTELWAEAFDVLLNPAGHVAAEDGGRLPVLRSMRQVREQMEAWLATNGERGVGLRSLMGKVEAWARGRSKK